MVLACEIWTRRRIVQVARYSPHPNVIRMSVSRYTLSRVANAPASSCGGGRCDSIGILRQRPRERTPRSDSAPSLSLWTLSDTLAPVRCACINNVGSLSYEVKMPMGCMCACIFARSASVEISDCSCSQVFLCHLKMKTPSHSILGAGSLILFEHVGDLPDTPRGRTHLLY